MQFFCPIMKAVTSCCRSGHTVVILVNKKVTPLTMTLDDTGHAYFSLDKVTMNKKQTFVINFELRTLQKIFLSRKLAVLFRNII
jgi:phosphatidate phosphatase PAH1